MKAVQHFFFFFFTDKKNDGGEKKKGECAKAHPMLSLMMTSGTTGSVANRASWGSRPERVQTHTAGT